MIEIDVLYTAWMKPGFIAMRNISTSMIAREHFCSPQAIVATISTFVSSLTAIIATTHIYVVK